MPRRLTALLLAAIAAGLPAATPALAALSDEVTAGQAVAIRLHSGRVSCQSLSNSDFEHLGEYVMERMTGSRATHEAMNARYRRPGRRRLAPPAPPPGENAVTSRAGSGCRSRWR